MVVGVVAGVGPRLDPSPGSVVPGEEVPGGLVAGVVSPGLPSGDPEDPGGAPPDELPVVDSPLDEVTPPSVVPFDVPELDELPELVEPPEPLDEFAPFGTLLATPCPMLPA